MICKSFENMSPKEKLELIGKVQHLVQTYESTFHQISWIVKKAEEDGLLDGIKILPNSDAEGE